MNTGIEDRLARIIKLQTDAKHAIRPPAPSEAIRVLAATIADEFGVMLPDTLCEFWSRHDGLWWDDYKLWRVVPASGDGWPQDVLTESRACRTDFDCDFVAIGGSSIDLYGFHCGLQRWAICSTDGLDVFEKFTADNFDGYFQRLLDLIGYQEDQSELLRSLLPPAL